MAKSGIPEVLIAPEQESYPEDGKVAVNVKFAIQGGLRDSFNEESWTKAYDKNDLALKIKYGVRLSLGGLRKRTLGKEIDTYRKASIFWTRNPKLVNPMKDRRVWVQVAKNFEPYVRLTEKEVKEELFDFDEKITFDASELGAGTHKVSAEVWVSWQKHDYTEPETVDAKSPDMAITIN